MKKFWLVWKDGGGAPTMKHLTPFSARQEAERLARMHGGTFHVLEVVGSCHKSDVDWKWFGAEIDNLPF